MDSREWHQRNIAHLGASFLGDISALRASRQRGGAVWRKQRSIANSRRGASAVRVGSETRRHQAKYRATRAGNRRAKYQRIGSAIVYLAR